MAHISAVSVLPSTLSLLLLLQFLNTVRPYVVYLKREDLPYNEEFLSVVPDTDLQRERRSASNFLLSIQKQEDACETRILHGHRPAFGHAQNGSRLEIRQDEHFYFEHTFVECANEVRVPCKGTDNRRFTSECVTLYEHRTGAVRLLGTTGAFTLGNIRVPIACQCKLRKIRHGAFELGML